MLVHDLSERARRSYDAFAFVLAGVSGAGAAASLMQALSIVALIVSIVAGILSAAWTATRFYDRQKSGAAPSNDG